jgi:hypothetical protein
VTELLLLPSSDCISAHASVCRLAPKGNESLTFWGLLAVASFFMLVTYDGRNTGKGGEVRIRLLLYLFLAWHAQ